VTKVYTSISSPSNRMRADLLPSVAADLLRQSLEHLASPTVVVSGQTADTTIVIANAAARDFGFTEDASPEQRLAELLRPPQNELELATGAMRNHHAVLLRWTHPDGELITFRVNPLEPSEGHQLSVATWTQQSPCLPPADGASTDGVARYGFAHTQRDLHDWLARTPITRSNLQQVVRDLTERIADLFGLARAAVWLFSDDEQQLTCTDLFVRSTQTHSSGESLQSSDCLTEFDALRRSLYVDINDTETDPRAAGYRDSYLRPLGITSMLDAAIRFGSRCYGTLCLEHVDKPYVWQQHELDFACTIASYLASALEALTRTEAVQLGGEREQFLNAIFDGSPIGIQVFAPDGTSRRMNPAMQDLLGLPDGQTGTGRYNLLADPQSQTTGIDTMFAQALAGEPTHIGQHAVDFTTAAYANSSRRREKFWMESVFFPLVDNDEAGAVVVFAWEVTERVTAQREHERLETQRRQSQKLEAVGQLAGGVAHDFNNILTAVRGFADLLTMQLDEDAPEVELVQQICTAAERGSALTKQLLTFGGRQMTNIEVFDASNAITEMIPMLRRLLEANIHIELSATTTTHIEADRNQLQQVILNLVVNARDAMPNGGTVSIHVETTAQDADGNPAAATDPTHMSLTVSDTGKGMDEATLVRIFEPFFTTKPAGRGTGLGLSTIYGIVTESRATISATSEPGQGATFQIDWPLSLGKVVEQTRDERSLHSTKHETVLVVEDDEANRLLAASILKSYGYNVMTADHGHAALEVPEETKIDLLLTDVVMPGIGGRVLAEEFQKRRPGLPVVFMSGYTADGVIRKEVQEHTVGFLAKPYSAIELAGAVRSVLDQ
jgi:PAS domain S-box-containing protein